MFRKTVSGIMLILLLTGLFSLAINLRPVKSAWTGTVYIRADGSIDPPDAPIHRDGNVYILTDNITSSGNGIVVARDNIVVDGAGHKLEGISKKGYGVLLSGKIKVTIKNIIIRNFDVGIRLEGSSNNTICRNYIENNRAGISLWTSSKNILCNNNITLNNPYGIRLEASSDNIIRENYIEISEYGIYLYYYCSDNTICGNHIINNVEGIGIAYSSSNNILYGNDIKNNWDGIILDYSSNNMIFHNNFIYNSRQVYSIHSGNVWDDGYPSGGNFWSDYMDRYPNAKELNGSGLWDTPYVIDKGNRDRYPLMYPYGSQIYKLTIMTTAGGTTNPEPGVHTYLNGTKVNVTAVPDIGYSFDYWLLDGELKTENPITVLMDSDHTLEAYFVDDIPPELSDPWQEPPPDNVQPFQNVTVWVNVTDYGSGIKNVTLWYSLDNGTTWEPPINMTALPVPSGTAVTYEATIPGYGNCTWITYKIIAYDNSGNNATKDNNDFYYKYHVIPEFPLIITLLLMLIVISIIVPVKRKVLRTRFST